MIYIYIYILYIYIYISTLYFSSLCIFVCVFVFVYVCGGRGGGEACWPVFKEIVRLMSFQLMLPQRSTCGPTTSHWQRR